MRRSVPLHPTDYGYGYHPIQQAFARALSTWIPYYRICGERWENEDGSYIPFRTADHKISRRESKPLDYYSRISFMSPFYPFGMELLNEDDMSVIQTWQQAAPIMIQGDYYPLSGTEKSETGWFVNEFYRPETGKGFLQAVRNRTCTQEIFCAHLCGLDPEANYRFINYRTGEIGQYQGEYLLEHGFAISIPARDAAAWIFEKIDS
jgi:hypothetical protein